MFLGKEVRVFLKGNAREAYLKLKERGDKEARMLLDSFERVKSILVDNPQFGNPVSRNLIPEEYRKMGVGNIYRVPLSNYWRALYTIEGDRVEIFVFVLEIVDHKDYNGIMGYK